jgi:ribonuclease J
VASPESIVIMKGMQDTGVSSLETDTAYFSPRQPSDELGLYLSSVAGMNYQGRDFCCTEEPSEALTCFLSRKPGQDGKRAKKLDPGGCCSFDNAAFPFEISAHPVDHSIFGATAYILGARPPSHIQGTSGCTANRNNPRGSSSGGPGKLRF